MNRLRQLAFGWLCQARGFHRSVRTPIPCVGMVQGDSPVIWTHSWLKFRCLCGAETMRNADVGRGGRVVIPVEWPLARSN